MGVYDDLSKTNVRNKVYGSGTMGVSKKYFVRPAVRLPWMLRENYEENYLVDKVPPIFCVAAELNVLGVS